MKIAFCFSGQMRTGVAASAAVLNYIGDLLPSTTFFCHTWDQNTRKPLNMDAIIRDPYYVTQEDIDQFIRIYNLHISQWQLEAWSAEHSALKENHIWLPMYYSFKRSVELVKTYEQQQGHKFDLIIKYRPDLILDSNRKLSVDLIKSLAPINFNLDNKILVENYEPSAGTKMDDVFFVGTPEVMYKIANIVDMIQETGDVNENNHLQSLNTTPHPIVHFPHNGYTIYREECTHINPLNWIECFECNNQQYNERK